ncbi:PREDICTED: uncharacterized protein LOC108694766 [Atta colombica]|uniref:uncharacterized protein LOC108694766 n=1 Tax=Atta colombica TaxID=520822 RepID=UPI00084C98A2|nr:PREDICTED: uncharacterized protein LOC108694766 [Atta colombica]
MVATLQLAIWDCYAVNGIIWHKQQQEFVQLFSIPQFAALQKENLAKRQTVIEKLDMSGEVVKAVYYEEMNMVMFKDNDTKIDGIFGQLWYLLEDYLNFTFIPIKSIDRNFGELLENGNHSGLLGMLERNEAQVIMRSTFYFSRMNAVDYITPAWKSTYYIYVHPKWLYDNTWVFTLFSWQTWLYIIFLFIILSCVGYFLQKVSMSKSKHKRKDSFTYRNLVGENPSARMNFIDIAEDIITKFREVGLLDDLKNTWFNAKLEEIDQEIFNPIDFHQVYFIFLMLYYGILISFVILILENITYYYKIKNIRQFRCR